MHLIETCPGHYCLPAGAHQSHQEHGPRGSAGVAGRSRACGALPALCPSQGSSRAMADTLLGGGSSSVPLGELASNRKAPRARCVLRQSVAARPRQSFLRKAWAKPKREGASTCKAPAFCQAVTLIRSLLGSSWFCCLWHRLQRLLLKKENVTPCLQVLRAGISAQADLNSLKFWFHS